MMTRQMRGALLGISVMAHAAAVEHAVSYPDNATIGGELDAISKALENIVCEIQRVTALEDTQPESIGQWMLQAVEREQL